VQPVRFDQSSQRCRIHVRSDEPSRKRTQTFREDCFVAAFDVDSKKVGLDLADATTLQPAQGDDTVTPIGISVDADGAAVAVYKSTKTGVYNTYALLQVTKAPGATSFGAATQIPWIVGYGLAFTHASDGTALLYGLGNTYKTELTSVRAPGGAFGPITKAFDVAPGFEIGTGGTIYASALAGGRALVGLSVTDDNGATCADKSDTPVQAQVNAYDGSTWTSYYRGVGDLPGPDTSQVAGISTAGTHIVVVTREASATTSDCSTSHVVDDALTARLGSITDATPLTTSHTVSTLQLGGSNSTSSGHSITVLTATPGGGAIVGVDVSGNPAPPQQLAIYEDQAAQPAPSPSPASSRRRCSSCSAASASCSRCGCCQRSSSSPR